MKKGIKIATLILSTVLLGTVLMGCGEKNAPTNETETQVESVSENTESVAEEGETVVEETPYFVEHPITTESGKEFSLPFAVSTCNDEDQSKLEYKGVAATPVDNETITIDNIAVSDDEADADYEDIQIDMTVKSVYRVTLDYFEYEEVEYLVNCQSNFFNLIDFYTGQTMPYLTYDSKAPGYDFTKVINWGGKSYNISYSVIKNTSGEQGDWEADEEDTEFRYEYYDTTMTHNISLYIKMPKNYDGLMLYAKKDNVEFDNEQYYENKVPDSVVIFDKESAGSIDDYMFVKVTDLID